MSKLRDDESKKKVLQEENDVLLEIGKEGKEGDKNFREYASEKDKISKVKRDIALGELEERVNKLGYFKFLADVLFKRLSVTVDLVSGWSYKTMPSETGVVMELYSPDGRIFRSAFKPVRDPMVDLNAIDNFAVRADNTIEKIENDRLIITK